VKASKHHSTNRRNDRTGDHMIGRIARALLVAALVAGFAWQGQQVTAQSTLPCGTAIRVLVISSDGNEAGLPAIRAALDYACTPYDIFIASQHPGGPTSDLLSSGCRALYQGVILTTNT